MKRAQPSDAAPTQKSTLPSCVSAPNCPLTLLPREVSRQILAHLFPEQAVVAGRIARVVEAVSRFSLSCRDASELTAWYFQQGPGMAIRYRLARYYADHLLGIGERPEHIRHTLLQRFSHMEEGGIFADVKGNGVQYPQSIFFRGGSLNVWRCRSPGGAGEICGSGVIVRGYVLGDLAQWIKSAIGPVDLDIEAAAPLAIYRSKEDYRALADADQTWHGEIRFQGIGAPAVLHQLLPRFAQHGWHVEWRNGRVVAGSGSEPQETPVPEMAWTRQSRHPTDVGGWYLTFPDADWQTRQSQFARRLVFEDVNLDQNWAQDALCAVIWDGPHCGGGLDLDVLSTQSRLHTAVVTLNDDADDPWDIDEDVGIDQVLEALIQTNELRHLHLSLSCPSSQHEQLHGLAECNPHLSSLTFDLPFCDPDLPAMQKVLFSKKALARLTLTNLAGYPSSSWLIPLLVARPGMQELRLHGNREPKPDWMRELEPVLAKHPGLRLIEIHQAPLDRLAELCRQSARHDVELSDGVNVIIVPGRGRQNEPAPQ